MWGLRRGRREGKGTRMAEYSSMAVGAPNAFRPTNISGNVLWLRGDKGITLNDATITSPNDFDNAAWTKTRCSITANTAQNPFGTGVEADSLVEDASLNTHPIQQATTNVVAGIPFTAAVYAKAGARTWAILSVNGGAAGVSFNLATGAVGTAFGGAVGTAISQGNGWYRLNVTIASALANSVVIIYPASADNTNNYQGDGVSNILIWGAAVSQPKVSAWADQSGNANNVAQGAAVNQPLFEPNGFNARPSLLFDGADDILTKANTVLVSANAYSIFIVQQFITNGTDQLSFCDSDNSTGFYVRQFSTGERGITHPGVADMKDSTASTSRETWEFLFATGTGPAFAANEIARTLSAGSTLVAPGATSVLSVGGRGTTLDLFANVRVAEIIVYNKTLSATEAEQVRTYLRARYATTTTMRGVPATLPGLAAWYSGNAGITLNDETITFPNTFSDASWLKGSSSISATSFPDPFGGNTASSLIEDATLNNHYTAHNITNRVAGLTEVWTVYAKAGTRNFVALGDDTGLHWQWFNLSTGALGTSAGIVTSSITRVLSPAGAFEGWYKLSVTSIGYDLNFTLFMGSADNVSSYQGNGTGNVYLYTAGVSQPKVSAWADQSGNGRNLIQATAASQPLYIPSAILGQGAVRADGVDDFLQTATFTLPQPWYMWLVEKNIVYGTAGTHDIMFAGLTASKGNVGSVISGGYSISATAGVTYAASVANGVYDYVGHSFNGASSIIRTGGVDRQTGDIGAGTLDGINLFSYITGTRSVNSEICEVIIYSRTPSAGEITTIENYIKAKYGL